MSSANLTMTLELCVAVQSCVYREYSVKAIALSVERLLRYAKCSGSSEAGSTEQMCSLTSFSKHLLKMGVRAMGLQSFKHVILFFFGMGTMVDFFKHKGTTDRERDRLKIPVKSVKTPASWKAHALSTRPGIPSGPTALRMFTRLKDRVTSATERVSGLTSSAAAAGALSVCAVLSASNRA